MKNKWILILNIVIISAVFVLNYLYQKAGMPFSLKCVTSAVFVLLGIINCIYSFIAKAGRKLFTMVMTFGLMLAFLGDVLIGENFIIGAASFALGHIFFFAAYCTLKRIGKWDLLIGVVLFAGTFAFLTLYPRFYFGPKVIEITCIFYALIICLMVGKAAGNFIGRKTPANTFLLVGSGLFYISDLTLVLGSFAGLGGWTHHVCMGTYYPAVCCLAISVALQMTEEMKMNY